MKSVKPVLLVEDDDVDAMGVERAFKDLSLANPLRRCSNGEEALEHLRDGAQEMPCLILLDVNMPRMDGIEFLKVVKQDEDLKRIPVVMLTTSDDEQDKVQSYNLNAAGYILKPVDYKELVETVRVLDLYWSLNELPPK